MKFYVMRLVTKDTGVVYHTGIHYFTTLSLDIKFNSTNTAGLDV